MSTPSHTPEQAGAHPAARDSIDDLTAEVNDRYERMLAARPDDTVDGVNRNDLDTLDDYLTALWQGWTVVSRHDVTLKYSTMNSSLTAIILLRHNQSGWWLATEVTLTYWSAPGVVHLDWANTSHSARLASATYNVLNLRKNVNAPTLPALMHTLMAGIDQAHSLGTRAEGRRYARATRTLLSLDPEHVSGVIGGRDGHHAAQQVSAVPTLAQLGAFGDIDTLLTEAEKN